MLIVFYDGGVLRCNKIEIVDDGETLIVDDYRIVKVAEVSRIITE